MRMLLIAAAMAAAGADVAAIETQRRRSNAAIAAHRFADMAPILTADYTLIPGSLGKRVRGEEVASRLSAAFAEPTFVDYVRTPDKILVAANRKRATETGKWVGRWRKPDGEMRLSGIYQATWVPDQGGWRLLNESFVSLRCTGSLACAEID
jgi:hypothetical protein